MDRGNGWLKHGQRLRCLVIDPSRLAAVLKGCLPALALILSGPVLAAGFSCSPPSDSASRSGIEELQEVVVSAEQTATNTGDLQAWLRLLVGRYRYEGHVDLCGKGNPGDKRLVTGTADCIGSGSTPNVHCEINVRWPAARSESGAPVLGGESNLLPARVVYSLEARHSPERQISRWGLMFMQVDSKGVPEWASGTLVGNTFLSREPCVGIPGTCEKITRITARPDSSEISMLVDIEVDGVRVLRQSFLLHRESGAHNTQPAGRSR